MFMFLGAVWVCILSCPRVARAVTTVFFNASQTTNLVATNATSDTISSEGYLFTYTRDKQFTGGTTNPPGRYLRILWPDGLEAQAVTAGPVTSGARMTITRQDNQVFDLPTFTMHLLADTQGAGATLEVMPLVNGEDAWVDPLFCPATGFYGKEFTNTTPTLTGFDTYKMALYVDFALVSVTAVDTSIAPPPLAIIPVDAVTVELSWPAEAVDYVLESTTSLSVPAWNPVTNSVNFDGSLFTVQLETTGTQQHYRLRK
jgi:hypothetical protein